MPHAFKRPAKTFGGWVVRAPTRNYLRLASPDRGKYLSIYRLLMLLSARSEKFVRDALARGRDGLPSRGRGRRGSDGVAATPVAR